MDLLAATSSNGLILKKVATTKGGEYAGPCPSCGGFDRFRCWPGERGGAGSYWCRQCGKWGDTVQFLVDFCGYNYLDAFAATGREKPDDFHPDKWKSEKQTIQRPFEPKFFEPPVEIWQEKAIKFVDDAHACLLESEIALKYLDNRGLDIMAVKNFKLGYFPGEQGKNCKFRPRASWGLPGIKKENGRDKMLWIPRGIVIPYFKDGKIYRVRIRRPKADIQSKGSLKYYIVPGSGMEAMAINSDQKALVIVESELDGMLISRRAGSTTGVIAMGSASAKPGTFVYPHLKNALQILVALDFDQAGLSAWGWWEKTFERAKLWPVPEGKDPGEAYEKGLDIKEWVKAGLPPVLTLNLSQGHYLPPNLCPPKNLYHIEELRFFLKRLPIEIIATEEKAEIIFPSGFKNRGIINRVNKLFFEDEEVFYFFKLCHPDSTIHGGNCDYRVKVKSLT